MHKKVKKILTIIFLLLIIFVIVRINDIEIFLAQIPIVSDMLVLLSGGLVSIFTIWLFTLELRKKEKKLLKIIDMTLASLATLFVLFITVGICEIHNYKPPYTVLEISGNNFEKEIVAVERDGMIYADCLLYSKIAPGIWKCVGGFWRSGSLFPISKGNYVAWYDGTEKCLCIKAIFWNDKEEEVKKFQIP